MNQSCREFKAWRHLALSLLLLILFLTGFVFDAAAKDPVDYVNPFIGAGSMAGIYLIACHGKNFPGADTPAGMVQLSPDTMSLLARLQGDHRGRNALSCAGAIAEHAVGDWLIEALY